MAISYTELSSILQQKFPEAKIIITDLAGDENHYSLEIHSKIFKGLKLIEQHKIVKKALSETLKEQLHAITIKTIAV